MFCSAIGIRCASLTGQRCSLREDGDGALGHVLLVPDGVHLGAPGVAAHPEEAVGDVGPHGSRQQFPAGEDTVMRDICQQRQRKIES